MCAKIQKEERPSLWYERCSRYTQSSPSNVSASQMIGKKSARTFADTQYTYFEVSSKGMKCKALDTRRWYQLT